MAAFSLAQKATFRASITSGNGLRLGWMGPSSELSAAHQRLQFASTSAGKEDLAFEDEVELRVDPEVLASWMEAQKPPPKPETFPKYEPKDFFRFEIIHQSARSGARVGRLHTPHGVVDTPGYVAVATNAALKHLDHRLTDYKHVGAEDPQAQQQQAAEGAIADADADASRREIIRGNGQQLMFCNTYHLLLQPGPEVVSEAGGLHHFMNRRDQPLITDSGGFQVFSLANHSVTDELNRKNNQKKYPKSMLKVSEEGVVFRSYRDGTKVQLTPESSVEAQKKLGADLIIPLDELPPFHTSTRELVKSVGMTHRWEARSLMTHLSNINQQAMLGVIHGGIDASLRRWSANYIKSLPFDGFAIGGSLGRNQQELMSILDVVMPQLSDEVGNGRKPVHLLGLGDEQSIRSAVTRGLDTFDSCFPTRIGRHGAALTREGRLNITNRRFKTQHNQVIDPECDCAVCQNGNGFSLAYLHHLFKAKEPLGHQVLAMHNLRYMSDLMARIRDDILNDRI